MSPSDTAIAVILPSTLGARLTRLAASILPRYSELSKILLGAKFWVSTIIGGGAAPCCCWGGLPQAVTLKTAPKVKPHNFLLFRPRPMVMIVSLIFG